MFTALWLVEVFGLWCFIAGDYYASDCLVLVVCMCNYLIVLVRCDLRQFSIILTALWL